MAVNILKLDNNVSDVYAVGDIHGDFRFLTSNILNVKDVFSNSAVIVCGDCGFGFNKPKYYEDEMKRMNDKLGKINCYVYFIRGNHDDKSYFDNHLVALEHVNTVKDYSVISYKDTDNILCVGGSISIDRTWRKNYDIVKNIHKGENDYKSCSYWEDEAFVYDESKLDEIKKEKIDITIVCTHSAPSFCMPKDKTDLDAWIEVDEKLDEDIIKDRTDHDKLFEYAKKNFKVKTWFYGHFHYIWNGNSEDFNGITFKFLTMLNHSTEKFVYRNVFKSDIKKLYDDSGWSVSW